EPLAHRFDADAGCGHACCSPCREGLPGPNFRNLTCTQPRIPLPFGIRRPGFTPEPQAPTGSCDRATPPETATREIALAQIFHEYLLFILRAGHGSIVAAPCAAWFTQTEVCHDQDRHRCPDRRRLRVADLVRPRCSATRRRPHPAQPCIHAHEPGCAW